MKNLVRDDILDGNGRVTHFVVVKKDITRRVNADIELSALNERANRCLTYLQAAHNVDAAIRIAEDLSNLTHLFLGELCATLRVDAAALWLAEPGDGEFRCEGERNVGVPWTADGLISRRQRLVREVARTSSVLISKGDECAALGLPSSTEWYGRLPLIVHGHVIGVLEITALAPAPDDGDWMNCLEMIATLGALAIHNARLFEELQDAHAEVVQAYDATLAGWSHAVDLRDRETEGHSQRVTEWALTLGRRLGLSADDLAHIRRGALLHDVGKLGVPDRILGKPGPLTPEEWEVMRLHPGHAYDWLSRIGYLGAALDIPHAHHERWDGSGYPRGLKGDAIPLAARLFSIVDVWDALTSDRPYRAAWSASMAREYIADQSGKQFDPAIVVEFLKLLESVELNASRAA
jgi:HD-GYP domain-containing protein (c-di-GMP phosphodiesterase class II)